MDPITALSFGATGRCTTRCLLGACACLWPEFVAVAVRFGPCSFVTLIYFHTYSIMNTLPSSAFPEL
jgi:hypothetical protein